MTEKRAARIARAAGTGAVAGLVGAGLMLVGEKAEQAITGRPNSYVPARALLTMLGRRPGDDVRSDGWNHLMHFGTGATVGAVRGIWAATGIRGAHATVWHTIIRLGVDQTVENATGVGAPPTTWPAGEQVVDVLHKAVYSAITGVVAERALPPTLRSRRGRTSH
ncbi:hypothetical protein [Dietzia sp. PP-33]|jgi:hypothetical protein|uniref:hypothetical protein n=1 Tax=Dietzia sp. PP-33 TaxID=2957500 RepID=UPI0029BA3DB6|nr:hypothetical protein [Dietzia sp. PP-33]MDX2358324.1 hypothetical protein [Dietzia sp. PP-33]